MSVVHHHHPSLSRHPQHAGVSDSAMKKVLFWVLVFLALVSAICLGVVAIHWSINTQLV